MVQKFLSAVDFAKNELQNPRVHPLAAAPGSPVTGQLYYDTGVNKLFWWNGTAWIDATGGATFASPALTFSEAAAAGAAATTMRSDATLALFDATAPVTQAYGDAAGKGTTTGGKAAARDHRHGMPTHVAADHAAIKHSDLAAPTAAVAWGSQKITGLANGTAADEAVNKGQLDAVSAGLDVKASVRAATTVNGALATAYENADIIDGVTLATGDRILLKNQTAGLENGIYTVNASGAPTRSTDADVSAEVTAGLFVFVEEGTVNADTGWVLSTNQAITLGTTALVFTQFSGPGAWIAGNGLTQSGQTIDVVAGTGMVANANDVAVLRTDANGRVPLRFGQLYGDGAATAYTITHNLNSLDVVVEVFEVSSGARVFCDVVHATVNTLTLTHAVAPTTNQFRVVVIG